MTSGPPLRHGHKAVTHDHHPDRRRSPRATASHARPSPQLLGVNVLLEADNGQSAIEAVRRHKPDLVVLDLDIPA